MQILFVNEASIGEWTFIAIQALICILNVATSKTSVVNISCNLLRKINFEINEVYNFFSEAYRI